jgi:hypothetical protein
VQLFQPAQAIDQGTYFSREPGTFARLRRRYSHSRTRNRGPPALPEFERQHKSREQETMVDFLRNNGGMQPLRCGLRWPPITGG